MNNKNTGPKDEHSSFYCSDSHISPFFFSFKNEVKCWTSLTNICLLFDILCGKLEPQNCKYIFTLSKFSLIRFPFWSLCAEMLESIIENDMKKKSTFTIRWENRNHGNVVRVIDRIFIRTVKFFMNFFVRIYFSLDWKWVLEY